MPFFCTYPKKGNQSFAFWPKSQCGGKEQDNDVVLACAVRLTGGFRCRIRFSDQRWPTANWCITKATRRRWPTREMATDRRRNSANDARTPVRRRWPTTGRRRTELTKGGAAADRRWPMATSCCPKRFSSYLVGKIALSSLNLSLGEKIQFSNFGPKAKIIYSLYISSESCFLICTYFLMFVLFLPPKTSKNKKLLKNS